MKYFKERCRKVSKPKSPVASPEVPENTFEFDDNDKVGADILPKEQFTVDLQERTTEDTIQESSCMDRERNRCKDRLLCARRRKDIRLTRKEVACLQVLVQTVLSEHLVLSRELQEANERVGLPTEPLDTKNEVWPFARNVERLQSALERDAARLKVALLDKDNRLKCAAADKSALSLELDKLRRESAEEAEKSQVALSNALAERDTTLKASAEKDLVISNLRSELANLESKRSNEVLCMSRALTEREVFIKKLESQAQDNAAVLTMLQIEFNENAAILEMERTARHSIEKNLESLRLELKRARDDHEGTAIMLSRVLSDKEAEAEDLKKQLEDAKEEFEHDMKEFKRAADANIADIRYAGEKALAQKTVEMYEVQSNLKKTQSEVLGLRNELDKERNKELLLHNELTAARNEISNARSALSQLDFKLAQERKCHEEQIRNREAEFQDRLESFRSEAASIQTNLENRLCLLQKEASEEKSSMEKQLAIIEMKLGDAERAALRLPALESNLKGAEKEICFLKEKATKRNAELAAKKKEVQEYSEEAERARKETEILRQEKDEVLRKLKGELETLKEKKEEEAAHFREAIHEKDLEIRERQDRLELIEAKQEAIQKSLSSMQKTLEDTTKQHKSSMAHARSAHREAAALLKQQISEKSEEIQALQETVKSLHSKLSDQHRQHSQEIDRLKASSEKAKNLLEKRIREKERILKESEEKRASLNVELCKVLESREVILKELELVRDELKRTVDILWEAKAETRLALDTMADTERAMISVYADAAEEKLALSKTQFKIDELGEKWLDAKKEVDERKNAYNRLKVRFVKYIACREDELKAAGDSAEQNRAEAQQYLNELKSSRTELASTEERCRALKSDLDSALQKVEHFSEMEKALVAQAEQNKQLLTLAETEVENLKSDLCRQSCDIIQLKNELVERESALEIISGDLNRARALSAKQSAECQDPFAIIGSVSQERGSMLDPQVKLPEGVDMLLQNIRVLESRLADTLEQVRVIKEEHDSLKEELSLKTSELNERTLMLARKDENMEKLQLEFDQLQEKMSEQQNKIAELEEYLEEILKQASAAFQAQEALKYELDEGKYFLRDANSKIDRLTSQLEHERSRAAELQSELSRAVKMKDSCQQELDEKSLSIQDLSENFSRLESQPYSKEDVTRERADEAASLQERLRERDREVIRLLSLLEHAHQECDCEAHHESADGDGNKETHSDGLKELKSALAERDMDVAKLRSVIVDLQSELSMSKSTSDEEITSYRYHVEELSNEIKALRRQLEEQEFGMRISEQAKLDLHLTAEQTRIGVQEAPRVSPRRRPGAPGGAPINRAVSEGNGEWENSSTPIIEVPMTASTDGQTFDCLDNVYLS